MTILKRIKILSTTLSHLLK